jgi:uncharacterized protein (DUF885 family)
MMPIFSLSTHPKHRMAPAQPTRAWLFALQSLCLLMLMGFGIEPSLGQSPQTAARPLAVPSTASNHPPKPPAALDGTISKWVIEYTADGSTLNRRFRMATDPIGAKFREQHFAQWLERLDSIEFNALSLDDRIDWLALRSEILHDQSESTRLRNRQGIAKNWVPYADLILRIGAVKEHGEPLRAEDMARMLDSIADDATRLAKRPTDAVAASAPTLDPLVAIDATELIDALSRTLADSHKFLEGYDPAYTWWCSKPYESARNAISTHRKTLREKHAGLSDSETDRIVGVPIGEEALREALRHAWIQYSPEELIRIGEQEMAWCDREFAKAATEMGLDGDWRRALEQVKSLHVEPGDQPRLIRELAWEAIHFLEAHDLVTVPDLAKHGWRMEMMTPEAQRVNPYFLGGENIIVSFPTQTMQHDEKLMSLKSNNIHFCRATVHHELIPGHHLQHYAVARYRTYRDAFRTPFWTEGWALYWEMLLWDLGFQQSVEDRVGMLFWRRHRAARIFFSLNYQTGRWTPEQCVEYLIERVGHEPAAAAAEVRRSIMGGYGPLYQAAYLLGGLQIRRLHEELVQTGKMTNREFHDAILRENHLPIELLRYKLTGTLPTQSANAQWQFYTFTE